MTTKKCLVAFDPKSPESRSSDFLAPVWDGDTPRFLGLDSGKFWEYGRVVFVGQDITVNDVFARLVDSGHKIPSVEKTLTDIGAYLGMVKERRIDDVVTVQRTSSGAANFALEKTEIKARSGSKKKN